MTLSTYSSIDGNHQFTQEVVFLFEKESGSFWELEGEGNCLEDNPDDWIDSQFADPCFSYENKLK